MLKSLYIKNYALIDSLEIDFESGFSVITGETGAGKSIILGALSLILGQRADVRSVKVGETKCIIEGMFDVSAYDLKGFCEEHGIEYDPDSYILRREILSSGKSRAFINDTPVTLTDLRELGNQLIDIHSQHKNLLLGDSSFQLQVVDILSGSTDLLKEYKKAFGDYRASEKALKELIELSDKSREEEEYLRFQYTTLSEANLQEGEQEELEKELELLTHAEDIKSGLYHIHSLLSDDEEGIVRRLKESLNQAQGLSKVYSEAENIMQRLETAYIDLKDLSPELERSAEDIEFSPERLEYINSRLDLIYSLQKKHRVNSVSELMEILNSIEQKLSAIDSYDERIEKQKKETDSKKELMYSLAKQLSKKRQGATQNIEKQLIEKVTLLGMPNVNFKCDIQPKSNSDNTGIDNLQFLFSANKNIPLQPISEVASGGEISRVMLCLKSMIAGATALPTIIFDEIDTGVSGEVADRMGQIMQQFGADMQVIAITHLPQIAARGIEHYFVYKTDRDEITSTHIRRLETEERIQELAQMLSGTEITEAAVANARVMLQR